jgi:hypothetical protein
MKRLLHLVVLAAVGAQAAPAAQAPPPPTLQAPSPIDEAPLVPFELGATPVPFGPKPSGCSKLELIIGL